MKSIEFELIPFRERRVVGRRGVVGDFGEVSVSYSSPSGKIREGLAAGRTCLTGTDIPDAVFCGRGPGKPSLDASSLFIDGVSVVMERNPHGLRMSSRALHLSFEGHEFSYASLGLNKGALLNGTGVEIRLAPGRHIRRTGVVTEGTASGEVTPLALSLAIVFEEVETSSLTLAGAALMSPIRLINYNNSEPTV